MAPHSRPCSQTRECCRGARVVWGLTGPCVWPSRSQPRAATASTVASAASPKPRRSPGRSAPPWPALLAPHRSQSAPVPHRYAPAPAPPRCASRASAVRPAGSSSSLQHRCRDSRLRETVCSRSSKPRGVAVPPGRQHRPRPRPKPGGQSRKRPRVKLRLQLCQDPQVAQGRYALRSAPPPARPVPVHPPLESRGDEGRQFQCRQVRSSGDRHGGRQPPEPAAIRAAAPPIARPSMGSHRAEWVQQVGQPRHAATGLRCCSQLCCWRASTRTTVESHRSGRNVRPVARLLAYDDLLEPRRPRRDRCPGQPPAQCQCHPATAPPHASKAAPVDRAPRSTRIASPASPLSVIRQRIQAAVAHQFLHPRRKLSVAQPRRSQCSTALLRSAFIPCSGLHRQGIGQRPRVPHIAACRVSLVAGPAAGGAPQPDGRARLAGSSSRVGVGRCSGSSASMPRARSPTIGGSLSSPANAA